MSRSFACTRTPIFFKFHGARIITIDDIGFNGKSLGFNKSLGPYNLGDYIVGSNHFGFCRRS